MKLSQFLKTAAPVAANMIIPGSGALVDKVLGVPTPESRTGIEIGQDYKGFLDSAYPGTTPWEQLGANSPMGAIQSSENQNKTAFKLQERDLQNKTQVADQTNRAHIITSLGSLSPQAAQQGLNLLNPIPFTNQTMDWDSKTKQEREKLPSEISKLNQDTSTSKSQEDKNLTETTLMPNRNPWQTFTSQFASPSEHDLLKARLVTSSHLRGARDFLFNRGKTVPVFGKNRER